MALPALVTIILYLAALVCASLLISRRSGGRNDFFRGGRKSPWGIVAVAMVSTSISGVTFVSVPGMVEASQFSYMQMALGFVAGYIAIAYILLPLYYRLNLSSLYTYLGERFGEWSHRSGAAIFILAKTLSCSVRLYLTISVLQLVVFAPLGIPFAVNLVASIALTWLYTFKGGVRSTVWTDMIQTIFVVATVVLCIVFICREMSLDFKAAVSTVSHSPMSRIFFFDDPDDARYFWKQFLAGAFTTIAMTGLDQDMMQKNLSCRNLRESRRNVLSYGVAFIPVNLIFLSLGVLLYRFADLHSVEFAVPDNLFPTIACGADPVSGLPYMPGYVGVLFVLGIVAAAFSSAGSALTGLTTTFTIDILKADRISDSRRFFRTRTLIHSAGAVTIGAVILLLRSSGEGSVINLIYKVVSYTYGPLLGMFFFGIVSRRKVRDKAVPAICVCSPLLSHLLATHSEAWFGGYQIGFELLIINAAITAVCLLLASIGKGKADKVQCPGPDSNRHIFKG